MPLSVFIHTLETGDVSKVIRGRYGSLKKAADIWDKVFDEYSELTGEGERSNLLRLSKFVMYTTNRYNITLYCLQSLMMNWNDTIADRLRKQGYKLTRETFDKDIIRINGQLKKMLLQAKEKEKEIERLSKTKETKKGDFFSILTEVSKYQGYRLVPEDVTVLEFAVILKRYKEEQAYLEKQLKRK